MCPKFGVRFFGISFVISYLFITFITFFNNGSLYYQEGFQYTFVFLTWVGTILVLFNYIALMIEKDDIETITYEDITGAENFKPREYYNDVICFGYIVFWISVIISINFSYHHLLTTAIILALNAVFSYRCILLIKKINNLIKNEYDEKNKNKSC